MPHPTRQPIAMLAITAGVLVATAVLIGKSNVSPTPTEAERAVKIDDWLIPVPEELIRQVRPGMTYAEVESIIGRYYFVDLGPDSDFPSHNVIHTGPWTRESSEQSPRRPSGQVSASYWEVTYGDHVVYFYDDLDDDGGWIVTKVVRLLSSTPHTNQRRSDFQRPNKP